MDQTPRSDQESQTNEEMPSPNPVEGPVEGPPDPAVQSAPEPPFVPDPSPLPESAPVPASSPIPESAPVPEPSPIPEPAPVPELNPVPEAPPVPEPSPVPESSPIPEASPAPGSSPMPEPSPIPAPSPVPEPEAGATPAPAPAPRARSEPKGPPDAARCHRGLRPPVPEVWPYLSRPELLQRWLGDVDLELAVGGEFALKAWNGDVVRGRVLIADPPSTLAVTWRPHGLGPESRVTLRLQGDGPGTRVFARHEDLPSEPERRQARRIWREALTALRTAVHEGTDAHAWGGTLPMAIRVPLARKAEDVWPLLSTAQGLGKWLAGVERFDGVAGGAFRFVSRMQERVGVAQGTIDTVVPERQIVMSWEREGEQWGGRTKVEFSLVADPTGTALLILHSGFDKIAPDAAAVARHHYVTTWPKIAADLRRLVAPVGAA